MSVILQVVGGGQMHLRCSDPDYLTDECDLAGCGWWRSAPQVQ